MAASIGKIAVACVAMGIVVELVALTVGGPSGMGAVARTAAGVAAGAVVFAVAVAVLRLDEVAPLVARLRGATGGMRGA